jgi:hypothetical protein
VASYTLSTTSRPQPALPTVAPAVLGLQAYPKALAGGDPTNPIIVRTTTEEAATLARGIAAPSGGREDAGAFALAQQQINAGMRGPVVPNPAVARPTFTLTVTGAAGAPVFAVATVNGSPDGLSWTPVATLQAGPGLGPTLVDSRPADTARYSRFAAHVWALSSGASASVSMTT